MNIDARMKRQTEEFNAAAAFASALQSLNLTPVVDDDYTLVRGAYEATTRRLIEAFVANGRLQPAFEVSGLGALGLEIGAEIEKALAKFPTWPTRIIDAGNVVSEEAGELAKACLQVTYEPHKETLEGVRLEAIQTAAMCIRFLLSMDRYDCSPGPQHEQVLA